MSYQKSYYPKRPVKSFQDLEVYQKLLAVSVTVAKRIPVTEKIPLTVKIRDTALDIPVLIAYAHSIRFAEAATALTSLEKTMYKCNLLVVYLEQYRDIYNKEIETEFFEEQIKNILSTRMKLLHLQRSWKKFSGNNQ